MKKLIILTLIVSCTSAALFAQNPTWVNFTYYYKVLSLTRSGDNIWVGTRGGLAKINKVTGSTTYYNASNSTMNENSVKAISLGNDGKIWVGTDLGLSSFDGNNWTGFDTTNSGIPDNEIRALTVDNTGTVWMGFRDAGVASFDGNIWTTYNTSNSEIPDNQITAMARAKDGKIWIGTYGGGVAVFDDGEWVIYNELNSSLWYDYINSLVIDNSGTIWIGYLNNGTSRIIDDVWSHYSIYNSGLPDLDVLSIAVSETGKAWFGTKGGMASFDGTDWMTFTTENSQLASDTVSALVVDADETVWVGALYEGLASFDGTSWIPWQISNSGLPYNIVRTIAVTQYGSIWVGTYDGLTYFDGTNWTLFNTANSGLPDNDVLALAVKNDGTVYAGTANGGLAVFDGTNWTLINKDNSDLQGGPVRALALDPAGKLWIGVDKETVYPYGDGGIASWDGTNLVIYDPDPYCCKPVKCIAMGSDEKIWFGTAQGLSSFDGTNWENYHQWDSGLPDNDVYAVAAGGEGMIWVGTLQFGIASFDGTDWEVYNTSNSELPSNFVEALMVQNGLVWIGTPQNGMAVFDGTNWTLFNPFNSPIPSKHIYSLIMDGYSTTWIGTGHGVAGYNKNGLPLSAPEKAGITSPMKVYPNPAGDFVNIECTNHEDIKWAAIFDLQGKLRKSQDYNLSGEKAVIDLKNLSEGIYLIRIRTESHIYHSKLLVK